MKENEILKRLQERLNIDNLNDMQQIVNRRSHEGGDIILLSPTGTGNRANSSSKSTAWHVPLLAAI